jgi:hypothetical protein
MPTTSPQPTITYTRPVTPAYTPPLQPTPSPAPLYTPPPTPPTPVYTPPQAPAYTPPAMQPTVEVTLAQVTPAPEPPLYVPPTTQDPLVVPQPKVMLMPSNEPKKDQPAPPRPEKQYYIPSAPVAPHAGLHVPPPAPATPLQSRPASKPASEANAPWGSLQFTDGPQIQLSGEHAVVGRYDHDMGGIEPEVDLAQVQGADTVSRIHAALEHSGSTYTLTDLNSTNATRINGKRLEPDKATPINDGDTLQFGKITCTFKKG